MNRDDLIEYLNINAPFMTLTEMAEEKRMELPTLRAICIKNNIKPITRGERCQEYIKSHMHQTVAEIMVALEIKEPALKLIFKDMGLKYPLKKDQALPVSHLNGGVVQEPTIKLTNKPTSRAQVFEEMANKYKGCLNYTDLVYPKEPSWNI